MTAGPPRGSAVLRGLTPAHGFVLDAPLIGGAEAARRVFVLWQPGAELRLLPDERWLLLLPSPIEVRAELGPGLVVGDHRSGAVVVPGPTADVSVSWRGLPTVALTAWLPIGRKPVRRLTVLDRQGPEPRVPRAPGAMADPDLRAAARVGASARVKRIHRELDGGGPRFGATGVGRWVAVLGTVATVVALVVLVVMQLGRSGQGGPRYVAPRPPPITFAPSSGAGLQPLPAPPATPAARPGNGSGSGGSHWVFLPLPALLLAGGSGYRAYRARAQASRPRNGARPRKQGFLARLTRRRPAREFVRGRHRRYLRRLTADFERCDYDRALRNAIMLNGPRRSTLNRTRIALPKPRRGALVPSPAPRAAGASMPWAPTVYVHLHGLYAEAGARLESAGRIDEAAFVYADLMQAATKAVAVLERAGRFSQAAELAEGRGLEADLVVRLWWRAGERDRAVDVAVARGAFPAAVSRLSPVNPEAAHELRAVWVRSLRQAGDYEQAVEVAWGDPILRAEASADVEAGIAVGGPRAARLLAYRSMLAPDAARADVLRLLECRDQAAAARGRRAEFVRALVGIGAGPAAAWDREVATRALRTLVLDRGEGLEGGREARRLFESLASRADPLVVADVRRPVVASPAGDRGSDAEGGDPVEVVVTAGPGRTPVSDAAGLDDGTVLVACGATGVRILTAEGRVASSWDVPADRIVLADHGGCALLVARRDDVCEFRRLDLATRRVEYWTTLRIRQLAESFDGGTLVVADDDGIAVLAVDPEDGGTPRVIWRELDRGWGVVRLERTPTSVAAWLVDAQGDVNRWRWELPGWVLRQRSAGDAGPGERWAGTVEDAVYVLTVRSRNEGRRLRVVYPEGRPAGRCAVRVAGTRTTVADGEGRVLVVEGEAVSALVSVR